MYARRKRIEVILSMGESVSDIYIEEEGRVKAQESKISSCF
jgi:hypothetical protein